MTRIWLVGGRDPTGGAGLDRDRWAVAQHARKARVVEFLSADTRQGDGVPARVSSVDPSDLAEAFERERESPPHAVKLGLVPPELAMLVERTLRALPPCPVVLDPVLAASDGGTFTRPDALVGLWKRASLRTPNFAEACAIAGATRLSEVVERLSDDRAVLIKSCPSEPGRVCDTLVANGEVHTFTRARILGPDPRGTGCALASAVAARLALEQPLVASVREALAWLADARTRTHPGPDGRAHFS